MLCGDINSLKIYSCTVTGTSIFKIENQTIKTSLAIFELDDWAQWRYEDDRNKCPDVTSLSK